MQGVKFTNISENEVLANNIEFRVPSLGHKKKKKNVLFPETWNVFHGSVGRIIFLFIFFPTSKHVFFQS